jgi:hypothetical protein
MSTATQRDRDEAIDKLRERINPGDTIYTVMRHVSRSGMMRAIDVYEMHEGAPHRISYPVAQAAGLTYSRKHEAVRMDGAGMDMGFALVYELSWVLFRDGFKCAGRAARCPSNDHSNGMKYRKGTKHSDDPGYALRHQWQ